VIRMLSLLALCLLSLLSFAQAGNVKIPRLEVRVEGIKDVKGEMGVALWNSKLGYPPHLEHAYEAEWIPVKGGETVVGAVFNTIPAGEYAVSVVRDTDGNRKVDRGFLGFPKEGVGFSNDQKVVMSAPRYDKSKFPLVAGENKPLSLRWITGIKVGDLFMELPTGLKSPL